MHFNSIGTAETTPQLHKTTDGLRGLCGAKVIRLGEPLLSQVVAAKTCGELVRASGREPCIECNVLDEGDALEGAVDTGQLVTKIAGRLSGIHWDDLTTAERQIAQLLVKSGHLVKDDQGNLLDQATIQPETNHV